MYNLVSLNINGLNHHLKRTALIDWLKCMKADIVCLQETHAASHRTIQGWFCNSGFRVASSLTSVKRCGTAILVKDLYTITQVRKGNDGRFSQVEVDLAGDKLRFVSLYVPNTNPSRNAFFSSLPDFIDLAVPTFICGDFNDVLDPDLDRWRNPSYAGPSQRGTYRESVAALNSLLAATQTFPVWRTRHPRDTIFSWDHPSGRFSSRIDMIWAPMCLDQYITDCQYHTLFFSDHCYMLLKFHLGDAFARGPGVWKLNTSLLDDLEYCSLIRSFWAFWKTQETSSTDSSSPSIFASPLDWWDQGKFYLCKVTRIFARARTAEPSKLKLDLERRLRVLQGLFDSGDSSAFSELCAIQEELRAIHLREAKASQVRSRCRWAEEGETSSSFFVSLEKKHRAKQAITSIHDPESGVIHHDPFEILGTWQRYYHRLFTGQTSHRSRMSEGDNCED